ncbi:sporulation protein [Streptomyces sp. NPDC001553]|uniref:sporulation protein n=1 Tax=Streptomyces sp. NPDC001553 TaxID=3154385 RepID=UPI00331AAF73
MAALHRRPKAPNQALAKLVTESGMSRKSLAHRVNELTNGTTAYTHTSVGNWTGGMVPRPPIPALVAAALEERLGRRVTVTDIGMGEVQQPRKDIGLDFLRDPDDALRLAAEYWSTVDRRTFLTAGTFAITAYGSPVFRWLANPADLAVPRSGGQRVGRTDIDELWTTAEEARQWDSKFGGGNWHASSVVECLKQRAAPLLLGTYTETIGSELFTVTSELARVAAWSAFDMGHHDIAQRHFIQALRLARSSGDLQTGCYVLATMSLQAFLRGYITEAIDMAEGAYDRAKHAAAPRVLAFAKLAAARAYGRAGDERAATAALAASENLIDSIRPDTPDPEWLAYLTHARISADAAEIFRDLGKPASALHWNQQADAMPPGVYTRAVGIRLAVVGTAHLQANDLEQGLATGTQALEILGQVRSARAQDYVRKFTDSLNPWRNEAQVIDFVRQSHRAHAGV